jgi:hypothetical protein
MHRELPTNKVWGKFEFMALLLGLQNFLLNGLLRLSIRFYLIDLADLFLNHWLFLQWRVFLL